jgi:hypothetical protein
MSYHLGLIYKDILWKKWQKDQSKKKKYSTKKKVSNEANNSSSNHDENPKANH